MVGTKYSLNVRDGDLNADGNHRKSLVQALEASLQRLRTNHVDILWLHAWGYLTPPEEVMRALDDQVRLGKVLYLGISDTPAWVVAQMQTFDQASHIARGFPHDFLASTDFILGGMSAQLDLPPGRSAHG